MAGLSKPNGRRPASRKTRNTAINYYSSDSGSHFVSSFHHDKQKKYRQRLKRKVKYSSFIGILVIITAAIVRSRFDQQAINPQNIKLSTTTPKISPEGVEFLPGGSVKLHEVEKIPLPDSRVKFLPNGGIHLVTGAEKLVCHRELPFSLFEVSSWPTPSTSLTETARENYDGKVILIKNADPFGNLGCQLNSFFHAYDVAYDMGYPLYLTRDSWAFDAILPLFFGPPDAVHQDDRFWNTIQAILGVRIVKDEGAFHSMGLLQVHAEGTVYNLNVNNSKFVSGYQNPQGFFYHSSKNLDATKIRNHRNSMLRKLFRYPAHLGMEDVCSALESMRGTTTDKYTVVHVASPERKSHLPELNENTGRDHGAASSMHPEYVETILTQLDMLEHDVYLLDGDVTNVDDDVHRRFANANTAATRKFKLVDIPQHYKHNVGIRVYLAVLADAYLGNPVDQTSLWIARMRYALGMKNTYILTHKEGDRWVSYLDDESYLDLYDIKKLGIPWMG